MNEQCGVERPGIVFFGTPEFAVIVLDELEAAGLPPSLIVTAPDRPKGRGLALTPPPVKLWAEARGIPLLQPEKLGDDFVLKLKALEPALGVVVAYGKILPQKVLDIPARGILNVHPSLLPKYRGPAPVQGQILADDRNVGVTVMQIDAKMDHGPILAQEPYAPERWPEKASALSHALFTKGGKLLAELIPKWLSDGIEAREQEHDKASVTHFVKKEDGLLDLAGDPYQNFLKICAYDEWPGTYFFMARNGKKTRVKLASARYENGALVIELVVPEGGKEVSYEDFARSIGQNAT